MLNNYIFSNLLGCEFEAWTLTGIVEELEGDTDDMIVIDESGLNGIHGMKKNKPDISDITTSSTTTTTNNVPRVRAQPSTNTPDIIKRAEEAISDCQKLLDLPLTQQVYFSANGEDSQEQYSLNDKDTKKTKDDKKITSEEEYEASMDEIRENEVADRSMEDIIEDNTEENGWKEVKKEVRSYSL